MRELLSSGCKWFPLPSLSSLWQPRVTTFLWSAFLVLVLGATKEWRPGKTYLFSLPSLWSCLSGGQSNVVHWSRVDVYCFIVSVSTWQELHLLILSFLYNMASSFVSFTFFLHLEDEAKEEVGERWGGWTTFSLSSQASMSSRFHG